MPGRSEERHATDLCLRLGEGSGIAKNVSPTGIYFETEVPLDPGATIHFEIDFNDPTSGPLRIRCAASVVRVEHKDGKVGVGARILECQFERIETQDSTHVTKGQSL